MPPHDVAVEVTGSWEWPEEVPESIVRLTRDTMCQTAGLDCALRLATLENRLLSFTKAHRAAPAAPYQLDWDTDGMELVEERRALPEGGDQLVWAKPRARSARAAGRLEVVMEFPGKSVIAVRLDLHAVLRLESMAAAAVSSALGPEVFLVQVGLSVRPVHSASLGIAGGGREAGAAAEALGHCGNIFAGQSGPFAA
jgi:hypothetical protein